ncbi:hypothetical protein FRAAL4132 [Frankia alni ACN14a]|uniref:Uncharacterized protein n=1 Tax=Frankia alni (strain DSM 45986 / CECT 9034 / ACN14a) TaxID=326424 RepID=Q0RI97_FRAAA|nr:hypothetical protein [Frankia sp. AvcI1]CAJ62774.2 hypothetical protein FRAAL4132 [Frankia alni ACN14a]
MAVPYGARRAGSAGTTRNLPPTILPYISADIGPGNVAPTDVGEPSSSTKTTA